MLLGLGWLAGCLPPANRVGPITDKDVEACGACVVVVIHIASFSTDGRWWQLRRIPAVCVTLKQVVFLMSRQRSARQLPFL